MKDHEHDLEKLKAAFELLMGKASKIAEKLYADKGGQPNSESDKKDEDKQGPIDTEIS